MDGEAHDLAGRLLGLAELEQIQKVYLASASEVVRARAHGLYIYDGSCEQIASCAADMPDEFLAQYARRGLHDDPVLGRARISGRAVDDAGTPDIEWTASGAFAVLSAVDLHHSLKAPIMVDGRLRASINFARGRVDSAFTPADLAAASHAAQLVGLALERALQLQTLQRRLAIVEAALDRVPNAVLLTDLTGDVIMVNRRGDALLAAAETTARAVADQHLAEPLAAFRDEEARVSNVRGDDGLVIRSQVLPRDLHAAVSFLYESDRPGQRRMPPLELLSPREQEIVQLVSEGLRTRDIARRAFVSENTVKQHLKRIFAKTGVQTRAELVQRIWSAHTDSAVAGD